MANRKRLGIRNVVRLGYVSLFTDISTEMILGVLPLFIVIDLRASAAILGLIEGASDAVNYLFRVVAGVLTDRFGRRKPLVLLGYGFSSVAKPVFAVVNSWQQAFVVRVLDRTGKGIRTSPRDALISDSISRSESGKGFGIHRSLDQVGAVLGPLLAFVLLPMIGVRGIFWASSVPAVISLLILAVLVKDSKVNPRRSTLFANAKDVLTKDYLAFLIVLGIFAVGAFNFSFILLKAFQLGVTEADILLVYTMLNVATVILGFPSGILADRIGKLPVLLLSFLLFLVSALAGFSLNGSWAYAFVIAFMFGSYLGVAETVQRALVPDFTRPQLKGTAYAFYYMLIGAASLLANGIVGALWSSVGPAAAFQYSMWTSGAGILALLIFMSVRKK